MKISLSLLVALLSFAPWTLVAEVPQAAEEKAEAEVQKAAETLEALGKVFEVFGAALGGQPLMVEEAFAVDVVADVAAPEVGADPLEQQFLQQFRQLSKTELNFVRAVCRPNAEQDKKIKAAGDAGLKVAVKKFAEIQKKLQQGIRAGEQPEWPDPRKLMADVLLKSVKETLSAEAAKRYEVELEKRTAARKRAALLNLVAKLDKDLVLTAEQREKLTDALNSNWKDSWCQQLETFMYGDAYFPAVPDAHVLPVLTEKQKQIWNGIPKQHNMIWGWAGFGFVQAVEVEDRLIDVDVKADEPAKVDDKKSEEKKDEKP